MDFYASSKALRQKKESNVQKKKKTEKKNIANSTHAVNSLNK